MLFSMFAFVLLVTVISGNDLEPIEGEINIISENNIEMPILQSVFNILYNGFDIEDEINKLMSRPLTIENI